MEGCYTGPPPDHFTPILVEENTATSDCLSLQKTMNLFGRQVQTLYTPRIPEYYSQHSTDNRYHPEIQQQ